MIEEAVKQHAKQRDGQPKEV
eukprot:SAG11_NODE_19225_length_471_cov_1.217742_1_plen_20_part_10